MRRNRSINDSHSESQGAFPFTLPTNIQFPKGGTMAQALSAELLRQNMERIYHDGDKALSVREGCCYRESADTSSEERVCRGHEQMQHASF